MQNCVQFRLWSFAINLIETIIIIPVFVVHFFCTIRHYVMFIYRFMAIYTAIAYSAIFLL